MQRQIEQALTKLLVEHQDEDTLIEVVRRETGFSVRLVGGEIAVLKDEVWTPVFKVRVVLEPK